jgi:hypothetical protein
MDEPVRKGAGKGGSGAARTVRLKAALKANLGRRKAQARSRAGSEAAPGTDVRANKAAATDLAEQAVTDDNPGADGQA